MTLEEAIKHAEEVAELWENRYKFYAQHDMSECEYSYRSRKCANEHRQLVKWLKELKKYREKNDWIFDGDCFICSEYESAFNWWARSQCSNFCPNCGADMMSEGGR